MIDYLKEKSVLIKNMTAIVFIFAAIFTSIFYIIINLNTSDSNLKLNPKFNSLSDNWKISVDGEVVQESAALPFWIDVEPYQTISIEKRLSISTFEYNAIVTRNYHQKMSVSVNGVTVYSFPDYDDVGSDSILTDDWNQIPLNSHNEGDVLTIDYITGKLGYNGYLEPPFVGEDNAIFGYLKSKYLIPFTLSILLTILGVFILTVATVYTKKVAETDQVLIGLVLVTSGIWCVDRSKMPFFMVGSNVKFFLAFISLMMVSVLMFLYIGFRFKRQNQKLINIFIFADIALFLICFLLVGYEVYPLYFVVRISYIMILAACIYFIYVLWINTYGKYKRYNNRVEHNALRIEFVASIAIIILSFLSIIIDAVVTNNWNPVHRDWTGVGNTQMIATNIFAIAQLIIIIYKGYHGTLERETINKKLHESKLELMMGQIQPHFMFNTLSSIRTLIKVDPDLAYKMLYDFSNYLRANVDNITNLEGISFESEVDHIQSYVSIEEVRFGDRLEVHYDIQETNFIVPPLSIQPLVENAIKHGVCKKPEGGTVWLRSYSVDNDFIVEVQDTGIGFNPSRMNEVFNYREFGLYEDESDTEETIDALRQTLLLSSIRDDAGQLIQLEDYTPEQNRDYSGNVGEVHKSTGMKNIIVRLKEISNATIEIDSQENQGTLIRVHFPKEKNKINQPKIS